MTTGKTSYFDSETLASGVAGGKMGGRSARAKDFFDTILDVQMTATLLKCSITALKEAVRYGRQINGKDIPAPVQINDRGHMFFDGQDIKTVLYGADWGARRIRKKSYAKVFRASVRAETSRLPVCGSAARRNRRFMYRTLSGESI